MNVNSVGVYKGSHLKISLYPAVSTVKSALATALTHVSTTAVLLQLFLSSRGLSTWPICSFPSKEEGAVFSRLKYTAEEEVLELISN